MFYYILVVYDVSFGFECIVDMFFCSGVGVVVLVGEWKGFG